MEKMRISKYLSRCGVSSRRGAEKIITAGRVSLNGQVVTDPATGVDGDTDRVTLDGNPVVFECQMVYYALHKPRGYHCTMKDPHAPKKITDLVPSSPRVHPVGRLDADSEGLIVLTNDGDLTCRLTHPGFSHEKEYHVWVTFGPDVGPGSLDGLVENMASGMDLGDIKTMPCQLKILKKDKNGALLSIILREGKKRQIRRMCIHSGLGVSRLLRVRTGRLLLGDLSPGQFRRVSREDIL